MLRTDKDLFAVSPPFLVLLPGARWRVAVQVFPHPDGLCLIEPSPEGNLEARVLQGRPWHVADEVWELDYGVQIMTLREDYYGSHPAWARWQSWLDLCQHASVERSQAQALARRCGAAL